MLHFVHKYFCHPFLNKNGVNLLALLFCILTFKTPPLLRFVVPLQTKMAFDFYLCVSALRVQNAANCVRLAIGGFVATNRKAPFCIRAQQEDILRYLGSGFDSHRRTTQNMYFMTYRYRKGKMVPELLGYLDCLGPGNTLQYLFIIHI